ncbi:MAG: metallophosphoesterase [Hungatella sp.]|nr:metallophosphoesterase [Hungatella sp.]
MRKRGLPVFLAGLLAVEVCTACHFYDSQSTSGPEIERVDIMPSKEEGPTLSKQDSLDETIPPLELEKDREKELNPEIIITSDIHYLAKELTDFGKAFEDMVSSGDGKVTTYVWEIMDAFLNEVIERRPQALIITGDLTLEGERQSHEALAERLGKIESNGIPVLVIPGNHDLNNPKAAAYKGTEVVPATRTTPEEFVSIYGAFGYDEAVSRDPASLSYVAELKDGTWLLMLDSCQYENENLVGGMIRTETYEWIDEMLDTAWDEDHPVIVVAHHNLFEESRVYENNCTIEHAEELIERLSDRGISLFLSGHLHVQHYLSSEEYGIDEIVTGALSMSPCLYGVLNYFGPEEYTYHTERLKVSQWAKRKGNPDPNLQNFESYADSFLQQIFYNQAIEGLKKYALSDRQGEEMAEIYALLNVYAVGGNAYQIKDRIITRPAYEQWQEYDRTDILCMYMNEIVGDANCDYNVFTR